jgi:hypothetical protein
MRLPIPVQISIANKVVSSDGTPLRAKKTSAAKIILGWTTGAGGV